MKNIPMTPSGRIHALIGKLSEIHGRQAAWLVGMPDRDPYSGAQCFKIEFPSRVVLIGSAPTEERELCRAETNTALVQRLEALVAYALTGDTGSSETERGKNDS